MRWTLLAVPCAAFFAACVASAADPQPAAPPQGLAPGLPSPPDTPVNPADAPIGFTIDLKKFDDWRNAFRVKALGAGISAKTFDAALGKVTPNPAIIAADQRQPESNRAVWDYLDSAGQRQARRQWNPALKLHAKTLKHIELLYGIAPRFVVAIWGMESNYGSNVGGYNVFEALATLAYQGRRASYAEVRAHQRPQDRRPRRRDAGGDDGLVGRRDGADAVHAVGLSRLCRRRRQ